VKSERQVVELDRGRDMGIFYDFTYSRSTFAKDRTDQTDHTYLLHN